MSGPPPMPERATPKTMSSRLLTMKFMQRGVALNSPASDSGSPTTPRTDDEGSASKRRKFSKVSAPNTPNTPTTPLYDEKALKAATEAEEKKRQAAIEKRAAELGDSHWVLNSVSASSKTAAPRALNILQVGFAQIDAAVISGENPDSPGGGTMPAPARFRQFNMKKKKGKQQDEDDEDEDSSDPSDESGEESSQESKQEPDRGRRTSTGDTGRKRARSSLSTKRDESWKKSQEFARERRKREVNLNTLSSISSSGGPPRPAPQFTCNFCGKPGHKAANCHKKGK